MVLCILFLHRQPCDEHFDCVPFVHRLGHLAKTQNRGKCVGGPQNPLGTRDIWNFIRTVHTNVCSRKSGISEMENWPLFWTILYFATC